MPFSDLPTGARLFYEDVGQGTPVIVLHGMFGTARHHMGRMMGWLCPEYRVIGPSLRGYGASEPKPRDYPPHFYHRDADDLLALLDALQLPPAHIIGYSDGGEVALVAAGLQPERFLSVVTIGAVGYFGPEMRPVVMRMSSTGWITDAEKALHSIDDPLPLVRQWLRSTKMTLDLGGDVSLSLAPNICAPVLMLLGTQDRLNPASCAQVFLGRVSQGRLQMFECGHAVHDEQWPQFQDAVRAFWQGIT